MCNTFPLEQRTLNLEKEIEINETSKSRIIGLTLKHDLILLEKGDMK